ncbi:hypothetical protein CC86DRAFT_369284 [Ophiobolus disseminans]|uniref:Secreted protein n=1 Tax=Ophiobolus disseminans TaxID=1469910 RepID=A0A6A7A5Z6_9PLEO|nr:hypothetical protein CC86DRAFT_369284 [Ophiobolus disseminans]
MRALASVMVLATIFSNSHAVEIWIENQHWGDNTSVHIGNIDCGQDVYHYRDCSCDGTAYVHLGDIVPQNCTPPGGRSWERITAAGFCYNINGDILLD